MAKPQNEVAIPSLRHVIVFLICTFALTWLAFLPLMLEWVGPKSAAGAVLLPLVGIGAPTITASLSSPSARVAKGSEGCGVGG